MITIYSEKEIPTQAKLAIGWVKLLPEESINIPFAGLVFANYSTEVKYLFSSTVRLTNSMKIPALQEKDLK